MCHLHTEKITVRKLSASQFTESPVSVSLQDKDNVEDKSIDLDNHTIAIAKE